MSVAIQTKYSKKVVMKKIIFIIMIISFSPLNIYGASKSGIDKFKKFNCHFLEEDQPIEIKNPIRTTHQPYRWCHMLNQSTR